LSVGSDSTAAIVTLEAAKLIKSKLRIKTVFGLSNVSFGLPDRAVINAAFYNKIIKEKHTAAIINPELKPLSNKSADKLLKGNDENAVNYIAARCKIKQPQAERASAKKTIKECILSGLSKECLLLTKEAANGENYTQIIDSEIIAALNELGARYESGSAFLPALIAGSDAAKIALDYIRANFIPEDSGKGKGVLILATVKGDVHDIGKNIVKAVLANYGYKIIDLGKDVGTEAVLNAVKEYNPVAVGLSALMTTTVTGMQETTAAIRKLYPSVKVIVGGAVLTQEFAESFGGLYAKDPQDALKHF
jgi:5-methyltetrahydrofolate--homocysteine methyltransferase